MSSPPVIIIGAGLAGLACARRLRAAGRSVRVFEASDAPGGRVRTDRIEPDDGPFLIDRGFQVYLTSYPEGRRVLDHGALRLGCFEPGARVWFDGRFWPAADPLRSPGAAFRMAFASSPLFTRKDLLAMGRFDLGLRLASEDAAWRAPEETSEALLRRSGLSDQVIDRFFRPFFGGVFLDRSLATSARKLRLTYRMFSRGRAALPAAGMQAIPEQLAAGLAPGAVELSRTTLSIDGAAVHLADGETVKGGAVVVATDGDAASRLIPSIAARGWKSTVSVSFAADQPPRSEPTLFLDGEGAGPVNHAAIISNVQPAYALAGRALISASIVAPHDVEAPDEELLPRVRAQLRTWFGAEVDGWRHLRTDRIRRALPTEDAPALAESRRPVTTDQAGVFAAGDHLDNASINGALLSGRRAADAVLAST